MSFQPLLPLIDVRAPVVSELGMWSSIDIVRISRVLSLQKKITAVLLSREHFQLKLCIALDAAMCFNMIKNAN